MHDELPFLYCCGSPLPPHIHTATVPFLCFSFTREISIFFLSLSQGACVTVCERGKIIITAQAKSSSEPLATSPH
jgi:hypothetical protein